MGLVPKMGGLLVGIAIAGAVWFVVDLRARGVSARGEPSVIEVLLASTLRRFAVPEDLRHATNPLPPSEEVLNAARAHFADHCAGCHANDGGGKTAIGQNLYPRAPDMRAAGTQSLTDGEIYSFITNGIRLTGMPAWGSQDPNSAQDTWGLVHFIRHLPAISEDEIMEMERLNPRTRHELDEEDEARRFLAGDEPADEGPNHGDHR